MCTKGRADYNEGRERSPMDAADEGSWAYLISAESPIPLPPPCPSLPAQSACSYPSL